MIPTAQPGAYLIVPASFSTLCMRVKDKGVGGSPGMYV